jgi:hypothetical protein
MLPKIIYNFNSILIRSESLLFVQKWKDDSKIHMEIEETQKSGNRLETKMTGIWNLKTYHTKLE